MARVTDYPDGLTLLPTDLLVVQRGGRFVRLSGTQLIAATGGGGVTPPTLGVLSLSQTTFTIGTPASGTILGATVGSSISATGLPTGLSINGAARTFAYDGTGSTATSSIALVETLAGATGSPRTSNVPVTVASSGGGAVPVNSVAPAVTGTPAAGQLLTSSTGTWSNSPTAYSYQWKRGGANISGATASTYTLVTADNGSAITCSVVASNTGGSGTAAVSNSLFVYFDNLYGIGDSILAGYNTRGDNQNYPADSVINNLGYPAGVTIDNTYSIGGHTVGQIAADIGANGYRQFYTPSKPSVVIVERGTNDFTVDGLTNAQLKTKVIAEVTAAHAAGVRYVASTITARTVGTNGWTSTMESYRTAFNTSVRNGEMGADGYVDPANVTALQDSTNTTYFADGLHWTAAGHTAAKPTYRAGLDPVLQMAALTPTLQALTFAGTPTAGTSSNGAISGLTNGSTLSTTDGAVTFSGSGFSRTYNYSGGGAARSITVTETLGSATRNSTLTIAAASSGTAIDPLNFTTTASYGTGKFNQGRTAGRATVPTTVLPATPTLPITIECWVKTTTTALEVCLSGGGSSTWFIAVDTDGKAKFTGGSGGADIKSSGVINDAAFHHLALVLTSGNSYAWTDGVYCGAGGTAPVTGSASLVGYFASSFDWTGVIDEVAIFSGAKYTSGSNFTPPTTAYAGGTANLLGVYHLDGDATGVK